MIGTLIVSTLGEGGEMRSSNCCLWPCAARVYSVPSSACASKATPLLQTEVIRVDVFCWWQSLDFIGFVALALLRSLSSR